MTLAILGSSESDSWILQSRMRACEQIEGRPRVGRRNRIGAGYAHLRSHGFPTARIGLTRIPDDAPLPIDFSKGMNGVNTPNIVRLTRAFIYSAIDTCTRSRGEVAMID